MQPKAPGKPRAVLIYNIGNNRPEQLSRLIEVIEEACGQDALRGNQPTSDVLAIYADITAISREFGFAPTTSIETGARLVDWFRSYTPP